MEGSEYALRDGESIDIDSGIAPRVVIYKEGKKLGGVQAIKADKDNYILTVILPKWMVDIRVV